VNRAVRVVAGLLVLAAAVVLGALAVGVLRADARLERDDAAYATGAIGEERWPPPGPAGRLLGLEDDLAFRRALRLAVRAGVGDDPQLVAEEALRVRTEAEASLAAVLETDDQASRRARAANLLGILLYADSKVSGTDREELRDRSVDALRAAVRTDPALADAKVNLELVLALERPSPRQPDQGSTGGADPELGLGGASVSPPGRGY